MHLRRMIGAMICAAALGVQGMAHAESGGGVPVRLEGYLDVAPSGVTVDEVVVGFAGKARKLFITHYEARETQDRVIQVGKAEGPSPAIRVAHGKADVATVKPPKPPIDGRSLSLSGPANEIDQLMSAASGMHFAGNFAYREDSDRLELQRLEK